MLCLIVTACVNDDAATLPNPTEEEEEKEMNEVKLPDIDLNNWKVTLPIGNPSEIVPPDILDYPNVEILKKYMYHDPEDQSIVFFTQPGSTTTNSKYSRTELREQMKPGSNNVNWTYEQGGKMRGVLKVSRVSGEEGNLDKLIVMQIHGRLTNEQRELIGKTDNDAPPVLKIYWDNGKIDIRRKILKDVNVSDIDILKKDSWKDESHLLDTEVGNDPFEISIDVKGTKMEVSLVGEETLTFDDIHTEKWAVFDNYFKAGNYLLSTNKASFSEVKYYELEVSH